jgi:hypothetical protein
MTINFYNYNILFLQKYKSRYYNEFCIFSSFDLANRSSE